MLIIKCELFDVTASLPIGSIGKSGMISLEITARIQGVTGYLIEFCNVPRKPGHLSVIQDQEFFS